MPGSTALLPSDGRPPGSTPRGASATTTAAAAYVPFERFGDLTGMFAHDADGEVAQRAESTAPSTWHRHNRPPCLLGCMLALGHAVALSIRTEPPRHPGSNGRLPISLAFSPCTLEAFT